MLCPYCHTTVAIAITTLYQHHHRLCTTAVANSLFDPMNFYVNIELALTVTQS